MDALQKDITGMALQVGSIGKVRLTKGQSALLKLMRHCVENNKPVCFDDLVKLFYDNVSKIGRDWNYVGGWENGRKEWYEYDIIESYQKQDIKWQMRVRPRVRSWFVASIGILVVKNKLIVIPTIELEENN